MDSDEHRRILAATRKPLSSSQQEATPPSNGSPSKLRPVVPGWKDDEGPDQMPYSLWRTRPRVTPRLAWHPALRLHSSPNDAR